MTLQVFSDNYRDTLNGAINDSVETIITTDVTNAPVVSSGLHHAILTIGNPKVEPNDLEKVLCISRTGTTWIVASGGRGYGGSSASAWGDRTQIALLLTEDAMDGIYAASNPDVHANGTAGATITIDYTDGQAQSVTFAENCVVSFSNFNASGTQSKLSLWVTNGGNYTITWPNSPTLSLTVSGKCLVVVTTDDGGTTLVYGVFEAI